jgi:predicted dehydrogenase
MKKYQSIIIGAGSIGAGELFSHAASYHRMDQITLSGIIDTDQTAISKASERWNCPVFNSLSDACRKIRPDIISICTPNKLHERYLNEVLSLRPALVCVEKPVTTHPETTLQIIEKYRLSEIPLVVHYPRRFLPPYEHIRKKITEEKLLCLAIRYAKGIQHNGCHALDLVRYLCGEIIDYTILTRVHDYYEDDPSISVQLITSMSSNIVLQALDESCFTHFEVDVMTTGSRFIIDSDHTQMRSFSVKQDTGIPPGKRLIENKIEHIAHHTGLDYLLSHAIECIESGNQMRFSVEEAYASELLAYQIYCSSKIQT